MLMMKDERFKVSLRVPLTAAALSLMLTACGGGGSDDGNTRAVSASPSPDSTRTSGATANADSSSNVLIPLGTTGAITDTISSGTPSNTGTASHTGNINNTSTDESASGSSSGTGNSTENGNTEPTGTASASNTGNSGNATTPTVPAVVPLVSDQGVRGDVLLAMMDQRACRWEYDLGQQENTAPLYARASLSSEAYTYDLDVWRKRGETPPVGIAPDHVYQCHYPEVRSYSAPVSSGFYTFIMDTGAGYVPHRSSRYYGDPTITKGINHIQTAYQVGVSAEQVTINPWVTLKQREDFAYLADTSGSNYPQGREIEATLTSTIRSYSRQGLVPFGAINRWQDYSGEVLQLLLVKADEPNTVRLCTHFDGMLAKRLHCVTWQVPTDWAWGKELLGGKHYVIDDRSVYTNETGFLSWGRAPR